MNPCECGCGGLAERRYIRNHHLPKLHEYMSGEGSPLWKGGRVSSPGDYTRLRAEGHPKADPLGHYVREHVLIAEHALGRHMPAKARIHHVNGNKKDNRNGNLVICEDDAYHMLVHQRQRALDACGHADWRRCSFCHRYDDPKNGMRVKRDGAVHRSCAAKWMRDYKARKRQQQEMES